MIDTLKIIPSDTDLNTITTLGEYGNKGTDTDTLKNLPYTINSDNAIELFHLSVSEDIASGCIKQTLMTLTSGKVWYRYIFGMAIGDWYEFNASEEKSTKGFIQHNKTNREKDSNRSGYKLKVMDTKKWSNFYNKILNY